MALVDSAWYCNYGDGSTTGYYAVAQWAALTTYDCGALRRQLAAPAVGSERVFVVIIGHVASGASEPAWTLTRGAKTTDATITWQECTGIAGMNGDKTNTPTWSTVKNTAVTLGQVITDVAQTIYLICSTAGTAGNGAEPTWAAYTTAGATTADNTATWTNLGVVGNFSNAGDYRAPHARLANAFAATWGQAGNVFYVANDHAETQSGALTLLSPGTSALPCNILCVTKTASPPTAMATTASINLSTTAIFSIYGIANYDGVQIIGGAAGANASDMRIGNLGNTSLQFRNGLMEMRGTNTQVMNFGSASGNRTADFQFINTPFKFGATGQSIELEAARFRWLNTSAAAALQGTIPTNLFKTGGFAEIASLAVIRGVDLSAAGAGNTLVGVIASSSTFRLEDCKLNASVVVAATPTSRGGATIDAIRCDSAAANYRDERYWYEGTQTVETTIVRTGGASDGTTLIAWKLVTTANSSWFLPFESQPISIWNDSTSSITLTIYGIWGGGAVPNNDDIWIEAEYLGSSATPLGSFVTSTKANNLATGSAIASDSSTWGGSTTKFAMSVTFTPQMKGPINIVVKAAKASSTFYIDPRPAISGVTVSKSEILAPGVYANELSSGSAGGMLVHPGMSGGARG